jgi:hypothetical protein
MLMTQRTKQRSVTLALAVITLATLRLVQAQQTPVRGQQSPVPNSTDVLNFEPPPLMRLRTPQAIIDSFLRAETQLRQALNQHTFKRDVVLQTIGPNGQITGQYVRNSEFLFDDRGQRIERVTYHPPSTIREMRITKEDVQDLASAQLLGVDITESAKYHLAYRGEELLNGKRVYVLSVVPAVQPNPYRMSERYFRGTVWIDATTYQMVRVSGVVEPQGKQRFPRFETWREAPNFSNPTNSEPNRSRTAAFAFPSRTEADDVLHFPKRDVNYRIRVRYYDYKLFASTVSVKELDQAGNLTIGTRP